MPGLNWNVKNCLQSLKSSRLHRVYISFTDAEFTEVQMSRVDLSFLKFLLFSGDIIPLISAVQVKCKFK